MPLTQSVVEALAPDQASLKAATKLMKAGKWPLRQSDSGSELIWGECQGSGSNPYRVIVHTGDHGYKCTCPSRKFPCKHSLALMWMYADDSSAYVAAPVPDWVTDWLGRRRGPSGSAAAGNAQGKSKNIKAAANADDAKDNAKAPADEKTLARRAAAAEKRAANTRKSVRDATEELKLWIGDQLRGGLPQFMDELTDRCRRIAARMVDAKAAALASRLDGIPARVMELPAEERTDAVISELGKLVLLIQAWQANPDDAELHRSMISSQTRDDLLMNQTALRVKSTFEVLGDRITARRDGLVSQATWLCNLQQESNHRFALLLDFYPAGGGVKQKSAFTAGDRFDAELVYYDARQPLLAIIAEREILDASTLSWPATGGHNPYDDYVSYLNKSPWGLSAPMQMPEGRLCKAGDRRYWWQSHDGKHAIPLSTKPPLAALGATLTQAYGVWNGWRLDLLSAQTDLGWLSFDD